MADRHLLRRGMPLTDARQHEARSETGRIGIAAIETRECRSGLKTPASMQSAQRRAKKEAGTSPALQPAPGRLRQLARLGWFLFKTATAYERGPCRFHRLGIVSFAAGPLKVRQSESLAADIHPGQGILRDHPGLPARGRREPRSAGPSGAGAEPPTRQGLMQGKQRDVKARRLCAPAPPPVGAGHVQPLKIARPRHAGGVDVAPVRPSSELDSVEGRRNEEEPAHGRPGIGG